jgi:hypothetical protein
MTQCSLNFHTSSNRFSMNNRCTQDPAQVQTALEQNATCIKPSIARGETEWFCLDG